MRLDSALNIQGGVHQKPREAGAQRTGQRSDVQTVSQQSMCLSAKQGQQEQVWFIYFLKH